MSNSVVGEIVNLLEETRRLNQLNLELLEQLSVSCSYILREYPSLSNNEKLASLLSKAEALMNEIAGGKPKILQYQSLANEKKQSFKANDKETEPFISQSLSHVESAKSAC